MLPGVYELRNEVASFLRSKNINITVFDDENWVSSLAFLVDLTAHLNKLNLQLQGKEQLIHEKWIHVLAFQKKLRLWKPQMFKSNYANFPTLSANN